MANPKTTLNSSAFPIRTVSMLTGVKPITLRAWERRYGLIRPVRTQTGHRLYTQEHVDLIHQITSLLERGISIGQVHRNLKADQHSTESVDLWMRYRTRMLSAIQQFDEDRLEQTYHDALSHYATDLVTRHLLVPLLETLGRRWETEDGSVAEEHFFSVYLRNKLGARFHHRHRGNTGPVLLGACLPDELHEVGLFLFALAAHERNYRPILLGGLMPLADLPIAAKRARADAIVLAGSIDPAPGVLDEQLPRLARSLDIPLLIGGRVSNQHRDAITRAGAVAIGTDVDRAVKRLSQLIKRTNS